MELRYSFILIIGIVLIIILTLLRFKKKNVNYNTGKKVANTKYIKRHEYYKKVLKRYKALVMAIEILFILTIFFSFWLLARPVSVSKVKNDQYSRDIFLCMDISTSVADLNKEIVVALKDTVNSLEGERFGISIFNTSSITLVPLTDDYDFVLTVLDDIYASIDANTDYDLSSFYTFDYINAGTLEGNDIYGSSLVGDGLVSCINNFSDLEEDKDRTRIVIFSTDNDVYGKPVFTLEEAAKYGKNNNVIVYGIATDNTTNDNKVNFRNAVEITGGKLYEEAAGDTVKNIVNNIEKTSKSLIKGEEEIIKTDRPEVLFILLLFSIIGLFFLSKKVIENDN